MPQNSKKSKKVAPIQKQRQKVGSSRSSFITSLSDRRRDFLSRRPHRSFRLTKRRDYSRSLRLPGYLAFSNSVLGMILKNIGLFSKLGLFFIVSMVIFSTFSAIQTSYNSIDQVMDEIKSTELGNQFGYVGQAALVAVSLLTSGGSSTGDQAQQIMFGMSLLITWLAVVWLMRSIMSGKQIQLRDALYNCGAPIIATLPLLVYAFIQLIPVIVMAIIFSALSATGYVDNGFGSMIFWSVGVLVLTLSLYWLTTTILALIIVTLPGMRPARALSVAGDMVVGRRLRIMLRIIWAAALGLIAWLMIIIPIVMFDGWIKSIWQWISWLPLVPMAVLAANTAVIIWLASYVYMLYRKVVDDDAKPV